MPLPSPQSGPVQKPPPPEGRPVQPPLLAEDNTAQQEQSDVYPTPSPYVSSIPSIFHRFMGDLSLREDVLPRHLY